MKRNIKLLVILLLAACSQAPTSKEAPAADPMQTAEKRILQRVDKDGRGMLKEVKLESIAREDSLHVKAAHSFFNPMVEKRIKVERIYTFHTPELDSITAKQDLDTWIDSQGEWVKM